MLPEEGYSMPPAPWSLNREAYLPDKLTYQDVRQQPVLLYSSLLSMPSTLGREAQSTGESGLLHTLAESVMELRQAICEFMNITWEDVMEGLKMEEPEGGHWPSPTTIFSWVLSPPADRQELAESSAWPKDRAIQCTPPLLRLEWEDCYMLVITSLTEVTNYRATQQ